VQIGDATLYHGDCLEILPTLPKVDAVVTDPPYEIPNKFGSSDLDGTRRMEFHFDRPGVTEDVVIPALSVSFDRCNAFHVFCGFEQYRLVAEAARGSGLTPKPFCVVKECPPPPMPGTWWPSGFELAIYGYRKGAWFGDTSTKRVNVVSADSYRNSVRAAEKADHPTQKWLPTIQKIVAAIVPNLGVALDPFMGSGTTGVACANLGRKFIGIEIERKYFDIACERIAAAYAQGRLFA
jgi:hypothetical protein